MSTSTLAETPVTALVAAYARRLAAAGVDAPEADAFVLATHALDLAPPRLRLASLSDVPAGAVGRLAELVARRESREPLQHLIGEAGFRTLEVSCRPGVFVPRPETEQLVGHAVARLAAAASSRPAESGVIVLEPCTGSGVVALAIAAEVPGSRVVATDLDPAAVDLARENLARVRTDPGLAEGATVEILLGDLLDGVDPTLHGTVDVIISNPPYLSAAEHAAAPPEVRLHDPRGALVADDDGLDVTERLVAAAETWLRPGGSLMVETSERLAADVGRRMLTAGLADVEVVDDLTDRPRFVIGVRP